MDPLTIIMLVVLAVLIFFMFRNSKKRKREQEELRSKVVVGADVMTNFGLFGHVLDIDEENNEVLLESTPGTVVKVHRQVVNRVVEPKVAEEDASAADGEALDASEPEFGERVEGDGPSTSQNE